MDVNSQNNIMVCVTKQKTCERLIQAGVQIKEKEDGELFIVHVAASGFNFLGNAKEGEALDYLFEISKAVGADMTVLRSTDVFRTIVEFCENKNISTIVLGESAESTNENNFTVKLTKRLKNTTKVSVVPTE